MVTSYGPGRRAAKDWEEDWWEAGVPALCDTSISVGPGKIVAVVGDVGSGKSALVKALIGDLYPVPSAVLNKRMPPHGGGDARVIVHGSMAYCAQEAWLPKGQRAR